MLVIHTYTKTWAPYASVCIRLPSFLRFLSVCVRGFLLNLFSLYLHVKVTHYSRARSQAHIDVLITSHLPDDLESEIVYFYRDRSRSSQSTHHDQTPMPCTSVVALTWLTTFIFQFTSLENNGSGGCSRGATSTIMPNPIDHSPYAYQYAGSSVGQVSSSPLPDSPVPPRTRTYTVLELVCVCVCVCRSICVSATVRLMEQTSTGKRNNDDAFSSDYGDGSTSGGGIAGRDLSGRGSPLQKSQRLHSAAVADHHDHTCENVISLSSGQFSLLLASLVRI